MARLAVSPLPLPYSGYQALRLVVLSSSSSSRGASSLGGRLLGGALRTVALLCSFYLRKTQWKKSMRSKVLVMADGVAEMLPSKLLW